MAESQKSLDPREYLDPKTLAKIVRLEVKARLIVEGFISGLHKSPYHGFSVEFAEHREYVPGDDIRHVDWKVFGRSDRFYIKQYEEETNLKSYILLDASESMQYGAEADGWGGLTKYQYGTYIAAALSYLLIQQQDAVGLAIFDQDVRTYLPPSSSSSQFNNLIQELDRQQTARKTDLGVIFNSFADRIKKKGLVVIISDMFDDVNRIRRGLKHLRHKNHEIILFHVMDRDELTFPFQRMTMFEGLEAFPEILVNPRVLRAAYLEELERFRDQLKETCRNNLIDYVSIDTSQKLDGALSSYIAARAGRLRKA
ncbi:MAG: DUF58 domain-containing protein [Planctomycetes bacterium]|nr:DUF58 domain-containing protein [Planctomycetota bacterium]